jgi:hypothetical protein
MGPARRRGLLAAALALAWVAAVGCSDSSSKDEPQPPPCNPATSTVDSQLVPSCGVLWGVTPTVADPAALQKVESAVGRTFDLIYRFHGMTRPVVDDYDRGVVDGGRALHISIDTADLQARDGVKPWPAIASGQYDDVLTTQAHDLASLKAPVFVTFDHEANNPDKEVLGSAKDFVAMWRHVHDVYADAGATNVVWVWVMMGSPVTLDRAGELWPGNDVVDWISWDVYNPVGCHGAVLRPETNMSFEQQMLIFYNWVKNDGKRYDIDASKPMMLSEAGTVIVPEEPHLAVEWYAGIPAALQKYPQIKAIGLWNHTGTTDLCTYVFEDHPAVVAAVRAAGKQAWVERQLDE